MRVIFFGTPECAVPYLEAVTAAGGELVTVITQPDRPAGRGRQLCAPPVKTAAEGRSLRVVQPASCADPQLLEQLRALVSDILLVVAFGEILCPELLSLPRVAALNVHYSLLPAWRGAAPVQHALLAGLAETGVTLQHLAPELDAGDIVAQAALTIDPEEDAAALTARLTGLGCRLVEANLPLLMAGQAARRPQDDSRVTWAPRLSKADGRVDWSERAANIVNRVRAMTPWPGAYCQVRGQRLYLRRVRVVEASGEGGRPGEIVEMVKDRSPIVATGSGTVELLAVQPQGKKVMSGAEYLRGARLPVGETFEAG